MCELEWRSMMPQKVISHKKAQKAQEIKQQGVNHKSGFVAYVPFCGQ
jgi:hypothetical protein